MQSIIHDHYYEQSSQNDKDEDSQKVNYFGLGIIKYYFQDVIYPPITDVEAVDLEYLLVFDNVSEVDF